MQNSDTGKERNSSGTRKKGIRGNDTEKYGDSKRKSGGYRRKEERESDISMSL